MMAGLIPEKETQSTDLINQLPEEEKEGFEEYKKKKIQEEVEIEAVIEAGVQEAIKARIQEETTAQIQEATKAKDVHIKELEQKLKAYQEDPNQQ